MIKNIVKSLKMTVRSMFWSYNLVSEFFIGMKALMGKSNYVTFFGSARLDENSEDYQNVRLLASQFASMGFTIVTGGGPGIMEAANRGAKEGCGQSIGCSIKLMKHEPPNSYLDFHLKFKYFCTRKLILTHFSQIFVVAPGGLGTLDELFEIMVLFQTKKMRPRPIFLLNKVYWGPLLSYMKESMVKAGTINEEDLKLIEIIEQPSEIFSRIGLVPFSRVAKEKQKTRSSTDQNGNLTRAS